ncbi:MAG: hypothetical protein P1U34_00780 [Coxiellaceae bacterium]|nr:hypothetical protein [Coxiellaceae bacterium]
MSRKEPVLFVPEASLFLVEKISRHSMAMDIFPNSSYKLTHKETGVTAFYIAQGKKHTDNHARPLDAEMKKENRKRNYPNGTFSVVKRLTIVREGIIGDSSRFPDTIALKCYFNFKSEKLENQTLRATLGCADLYNRVGDFAIAFQSSRDDEHGKSMAGTDKYFLMMPYYGEGHDLYECMVDKGLLKKPISSEQLIPVLYRLLNKIATIHEMLGATIVDIKPENMIPEFDDEGHLVDIHLVDLDGALYDSIIGTPGYMNPSDFDEYVLGSKKRSNIPLAVDYRSLGVILSLLCSDLIEDPCYKRTTELRQTSALDYDLHTFTQVSNHLLNESQVELLAIISQLNSGVNPTVESVLERMKEMMLHDIDSIITSATPRAETIKKLLAKVVATSLHVSSSAGALGIANIQLLQKYSKAYQAMVDFRKTLGEMPTVEELKTFRATFINLREALFKEDPKLAAEMRLPRTEPISAGSGDNSAGAGRATFSV